MKKFILPIFISCLLFACGGSKEQAETEKSVEENMSEVDTIQSIETLDAMGEEIGDLQMEIEGRKAELDSLLKEEEKEED